MTDSDRQLAIAAVLGAAGAIGVVAMAREGLREGLDGKERKGLVAAAVVGLVGYVFGKALQERWWGTVEGVGKKSYDTAQDYAKQQGYKLP